MTVKAIYENGTLRLRAPLALAEGSEVECEVRAVTAPLPAAVNGSPQPPTTPDAAEDELTPDPGDPFRDLIGFFEDGPVDGAANHDKYIYGEDWQR